MSKHWRTNWVYQFLVKSWLILNLSANCLFSLSHMFGCIFLVSKYVFQVWKPSLRIAGMNWIANEHKLVAHVSNSKILQPWDSVCSSNVSPGSFSSQRNLNFFSWLQKTHNVRNDDESSCKDAFISGLGDIDNLVSKDHVVGSVHGACRDVSTVFLNSQFLPVSEFWLVHN